MFASTRTPEALLQNQVDGIDYEIANLEGDIIGFQAQIDKTEHRIDELQAARRDNVAALAKLRKRR